MARRYDPNDPAAVKVRKDEQAVRIAQSDADWQWLLSDPRGLRIVIELLGDFGLLSLSFVPSDPLMTAFGEGKRACALAINSRITKTRQEALVDVMQGLTAPDV